MRRHRYSIQDLPFCHGEGDQMIWKMTSGDPIKWVRVYEDESIDAVTDQHLAHLV